ncbi:MAG: tRNA uridine-5-carboxymethylaminomethyl(34) synthesis GTPase MnmE [Planctomycetes bacterium]|nr:tRNA uridine-5-carboxymethylaminomethyl(34) synthesis GTPase MnmE [Planctomycetota bacterium]
MTEDTIIAVATPAGYSLGAVIRLSGPLALKLVRKAFRPANALRLNRRSIQGQLILESPGVRIPVTLYIMKTPGSYTGEDIAEIHTFGVPPLLKILLDYFISKGARLAQPGEFTRRAFLNNRMDLTQAESVLAIIKARNDRELSMAVNQLKGDFSNETHCLNKTIKDLLSRLELSLDFSDQDIEIIKDGEIRNSVDKLIREISGLLKGEQSKTVFKEGISLVICGRPNVGKSSLFNRLLKKERAVVMPLAGTTRDVIEADFKVKGHGYRLFDTAGLGKTNDKTGIQEIAARQTKGVIGQADMFLFVIDGSRQVCDEDLKILRRLPPERVLLIINKSDLAQPASPSGGKATDESVRRKLKYKGIICRVSALKGSGITELAKHLKGLLKESKTDKSSAPYIISARYRENLTRALDALKRAKNTPSTELVAFELREALNHIGNITGATTPEDVLNNIFARFCIGK